MRTNNMLTSIDSQVFITFFLGLFSSSNIFSKCDSSQFPSFSYLHDYALLTLLKLYILTSESRKLIVYNLNSSLGSHARTYNFWINHLKVFSLCSLKEGKWKMTSSCPFQVMLLMAFFCSLRYSKSISKIM